ncbi:50S ribosomal protein L3 [bacterium]|nr:50S ribosomal protein L3 [bacterium]
MSGMIGRKIGMSNIFDESGNIIPVTLVEALPNVVTQIKTKEKDGYEAVQLAVGNRRGKNTPNPLQGHAKKAGLTETFPRILREFKDLDVAQFQLGATVSLDIFNVGDKITVVGTSKGKGFQGVVKRHGFGGINQTSHGASDRVRSPGSVGGSSDPSRVFKGMRMAGRMGSDRVTVKNLKVVRLDKETNVLFIKGSVPGATNSYIEIRKNGK